MKFGMHRLSVFFGMTLVVALSTASPLGWAQSHMPARPSAAERMSQPGSGARAMDGNLERRLHASCHPGCIPDRLSGTCR